MFTLQLVILAVTSLVKALIQTRCMYVHSFVVFIVVAHKPYYFWFL